MPTIKQKAERRKAAGEFGDAYMEEAKKIAERTETRESMEEDLHGRNLKIPRGWGELPSTVGFEVEVEWVYGNYERVVRRREGKSNQIMLGRARTPAPSEGALGLLQRASDQPNWFFRDVVSKVRGKAEGEDPEKAVEERQRLEDVRELLGQFVERVRAEAGAMRGEPTGLS